ncbi:MAG: branched-chain amino acid ABC transporter permease [Pseudomonadota bacterium]
MPDVSREVVASLALLAALAAAALTAAALGEVYYINLASRIAIVALASVGLNLALGFGGMISFGHAAFFGLGGYVAGIAATHAVDGGAFAGVIPGTTWAIPIWGVAILLSAAVAVPIGLISLRTEGVYFIMITLAFAQMIYYFAISFPAYGGEDGLPIYVRSQLPLVRYGDPLVFFTVVFAWLVLVLLLMRMVLRARFGAALTMARLNPLRLATSGVAPFPVRLTAYVLSAAITGLAGALFADLNGFVGPSMLSWHRSGEIMVIVILGGVGRLAGPVAGAAALVLLEVAIGGYTQYWQFVLGVVLLLVVLFARGGLMGWLAGPPRHG